MISLPRRLTIMVSAVAVAVTLPACAQQVQDMTVQTRPVESQMAAMAATKAAITKVEKIEKVAEPAKVQRDGPALWKVADEDTTIYLFGTIHALPKDVIWYRGTVAQALAGSAVLVTEVPLKDADPAEMQKLIVQKAVLPSGQNLRQMLTEEQRATYEKAMTSIRLPIGQFDQFEPWYAAMMLSMLPLFQQGYDIDSGVEKVLSTNAPQNITRDNLESIEYQLSLFDELPMDSQINYLMEVAGGIEEIKPLIDQMVGHWLKGDADGLAELMNNGMSDPVLMEQRLYQRNRNWAQWIDDRLDRPGIIFIAVGAGHLAGDDSVQQQLSKRGIESQRVQ